MGSGGLKVCARLADIPVALDTMTVYLSPDKSTALADEIVAAQPRRVMLNPGAQNPALAEALQPQGIEIVDACALVLLPRGSSDGWRMPRRAGRLR